MSDREAIQVIRIKGARQHNLRNLDVEIPRNKLVVITGPSGLRRIHFASLVCQPDSFNTFGSAFTQPCSAGSPSGVWFVTLTTRSLPTLGSGTSM